uniref:Endonuclease G, mitochondrial n=1 Tax=Strigamia maritima TaxID=126957 RepID=T1JJV7_STRMM
MAYIRLLYVVTAGLGYFYESSLDKWKKNAFKVNAEENAILERVSKYGIPQRDVILNYQDFQVSYDNQKRTPNWVLEHLTKSNLQTMLISKEDTQRFCFHSDPRINKMFQPDESDYEETGLYPSQLGDKDNHRSTEKSFNDTFNYSNTVPQNFAWQTSVWDRLETYSRYLTHCYKNVYVLTGPLYQPKKDKLEVEFQVIGRHHVAVPTHYFKVLICETNEDSIFHVGCYILPNKCDVVRPLHFYRVPLSLLEDNAGFMLFKDRQSRPVLEILGDIRDFNARRLVYMNQAGLMHVN